MNQAIFLVILAILLTSCNNQTSTIKDATQPVDVGKLVYSVSGDRTSNWEFEVLFTPENAIIKEVYDASAGQKYVYNKRDNEILGLIADAPLFGSQADSYVIYYSPEKLIKNQLSSNYGDTSVIQTDEFKEILGFKCRKTIINHGSQATVEVWLTDKIKPGIIYPWTPLTFESIALEYELKVLGRTELKYIVRSISDEPLAPDLFLHKVPDEYYLIVPASVYSIDSEWNKRNKENTFQSFTYPTLKESREETIQYLKSGLEDILGEYKNLNIEINIDRNGKPDIKRVSINRSQKDHRIEQVKSFIKNAPLWTPAKIKDIPVTSQIVIY